MKTRNFFILLALSISLFACNEEYPDLNDGLYAEFNTSKGPFVAKLYQKATPMTVANFVALAEGNHPMADSSYKDKNYYNGIKFHRVVEGFVIQGGDPTGTGSGGPGYKFPDEFVDTLSHKSKGLLSMANAGPGTNGSQFFVTLAPVPNLDGRHSVFGEIVEGQDVVDSIGKVETGPRDKPAEDVVIKEVKIIRKGSDAKNFDAAKTFKNSLKEVKKKEEEEAKKLAGKMEEKAESLSKLKEDAKTLDSGLKIYFENEGEGEKPKNGQKVMVEYEGYFENGTLFDTTREEVAKEMNALNEQKKMMGGYQPMATVYGPEARMIPGFKEGLEQMKVGDEAVIFIPSHLGYGEAGAGGGIIPPNTDLIFKLKIVKMAE